MIYTYIVKNYIVSKNNLLFFKVEIQLVMSVLKFVISLCKNDAVTIGQNKLQAGKCPHLYHCQETLSKVTNCPYNVYGWAD